MKRLMFAGLLALVSAVALAQAKYVFYFIGDGMGLGHVNTTQTYLRDVRHDREGLLMMRFPVVTQAMTYSASHPITDSAAAGTALSTGSKTSNGMIGMNPDTVPVYSIATDFLRAGYAVGIASTVAGDDATPGAFYAHAANRSLKYEIAPQAATSGYEFLAAPLWRGMLDENKERNGWIAEMQRNGYTVCEGYEQFLAKKPKGKTLLLSANPQGEQVGYTLDSIPGALTAAQITAACLSQLEKSDKFFMMVEGGNIDWAAHANDGATVIKEIINYQEAIDIAYKFYLQHPDETLIVVTADHDTGGMAVGRHDNQKNINLSMADFQKISKDRFSDFCKAQLAEGNTMSWEEMQEFIRVNFGLFDRFDVSEADTESLRESFDKCFVQREGKDVKTLYNDFNQFAVKVYDLFNHQMGIGWTSSNHTGNLVPVFAIGEGSSLFVNRPLLNNTDIPSTILRAAGLDR